MSEGLIPPAWCREVLDLTAKHHAKKDLEAAERIKAVPTPESGIPLDELRALIFKAAKKEI